MGTVGTDGVCVDVNMGGTWMLCGNGHRLCGPLTWWAYGTDGACGDVNMVDTWMLCGNGRSLSGC